ncbi:TRAP-type mannitol/chloroaromatic compound transport system permease small subunit [Skermanella aerolata]|uniref:TRAP transporter small permease protein n=1 Tax=Skermanella aerolata TaxID=393310 RepID=A0A512DIS9_9PROT|nr:TRAP transporter small permease subunit [Skermanella aerolata]KJB97418.1 C4-dicarboxylate ABC transporter [Skermanella aerolata KACC 11604]GEO36384.1 C4-dicarboxylate ABC transporter [Skermanella aerolata]
MQALLGISRGIDAMNRWVGRIAAWAIVIAILVSALNAIVRKVIGTSSNAWLELQWYLFGAVFMLCAAWTLIENEHIRIDIVANRFSRKVRNWIDVIGHVFFLGGFCAVLIYTSIPFFLNSYASSEVSTNAGGLIIWPAKLAILVGFILLALQAVSELIKRIAIMRGVLPDPGIGGHHDIEGEVERLLSIQKESAVGIPADADSGGAPAPTSPRSRP